MSNFLSPVIRQQGFKLGVSAPGAVLQFFLSGTSTPTPVYNAAGTSLGTSITADSTGRFAAFFLAPLAYRMTMRDSGGSVIWGPEDGITTVASSADSTFVQAGTGAVTRTVQSKLREVISVDDFGAVSGAESTAAFQAAFTAAQSLERPAILIPGSGYIISDVIQVLGASGQQGFEIYGQGPTDTTIRWKGNATGPMFYFGGAFMADLSRVRLAPFSASFPIASMIVQEQSGAGTSSMNRYARMLIEGLGVMTQGIYLKGSVTDANNDFTDFEKVFINGYTEAGVLLQGANCFNNRFLDCQIAGGRVGHYGIKSISGAGGEAAHIAVYGGALLGNLVSDIYIQTRNSQPFIFDNVYSEGSQAFITTGTNGNATTIVIRGLKYANDLKTGTDPDIQIGFPGHITIEDSQLGTDYAKTVRVLWNYTAGFFAPSLRCEGLRVWGAASTLAGIFTGSIPTSMVDTFWQTSDTTYGQLNVGASVSWSPAPVIGGVTSQTGQTYSAAFGKYTRQENQITFWATATLTAKGTITGDIVIRNLPFVLQTGTGTVICNVYFENLLTNWITVQGLLDAGTSQLRLVGVQAAGTSPIALTAADIGNTTKIIVSGVYWTD